MFGRVVGNLYLGITSGLPMIQELSRFEKVLRLLVLDAAHLLRFLDEPPIIPFVCLLRVFQDPQH